jgi:hypothetical protein
MSETEKSLRDFLQRWSRRKLGLEEPPPPSETPQAQPEQTESAESNAPGAPSAPSEPSGAAADSAAAPFDLARLPPIESIDASTDIRAFLAPGVPAELTRAALRRAWLSDPAIRDFVGLAENQWDFTNPDTVPGFGTLELTPELRSLMAGLLRESSANDADACEAEPAGSAIAAAPAKTLMPEPETRAGAHTASVSGVVAAPIDESAAAHAAMQKNSLDERPEQLKPKHGGALPK